MIFFKRAKENKIKLLNFIFRTIYKFLNDSNYEFDD